MPHYNAYLGIGTDYGHPLVTFPIYVFRFLHIQEAVHTFTFVHVTYGLVFLKKTFVLNKELRFKITFM